MKHTLFLFSLFIFIHSYSQINKKSVVALRVNKSPIIDGVLDDDAWKNAQEAKDFVMYEPGNGTKEPENRKSIVKIVYNDQAIYFSALLFDNEPNEIPRQFGGRDEIGQVDYFQVNINPNNDSQNDTEFIVMATGAQADAKPNFSSHDGDFRNKDFSWSAVWNSSVSITSNGWIVEMEIPYSALRFSNTKVQTWGINFQRKMHKHDEVYSWNYIDKSKGKYPQYAGNLKGIRNVKPPTRLNFSPYASSSYTIFNGDSEFANNIGLDLKYGINESFTLDATLIPDFGQTAFDNQVLNLSPFEQHYTEKRTFFTEGTELFSKGRLFYSRRIGNTPTGYYDIENNLSNNEEIIENPIKVNMLNAIKLSGRTKKGLGIGVFNAITEKTSAKIKNLTTNEIRKEITEPITNYSVLVLDQQFNKNSSVSFVNTNVIRSGNFRDSNVSSLMFDISDKKNKYNASGNFKLSTVNELENNTQGYSTFLKIGKTFGNYQYTVGHFRSNSSYDIADLGFLRRNNYANYFGVISYQIFEPTKTFNSYKISLESSLRYQNNPNMFAESNIEIESFFVTTKRLAFRADLEFSIGKQNDFYEPRVEGRFIQQKGVIIGSSWISTDYRKKLAVDVRGVYAERYGDSNTFFALMISPRYRFSDKFQIIYEVKFSKMSNEKGWVNELDNGSIIFGNRDGKTVTNTLSGKLSFNTKSTLELSFRHFWSPINYDNSFFELNNNGTLNNSTYTENHNINYNIWNLDLSYSWEFSPGSQLVALYRNSIFNEDNLSNLSFNNNLGNLFNEPIVNNFSLKFIYYLDYNKLKTWL